MTPTAAALSRAMLRRHARSFSWAGRLLPSGVRADATALYAWCRRCDDAVDLAAHPVAARAGLSRLRAELDAIYGPHDLDDLEDPILAGFQDVVRRRRLPRRPCDELLDGMEMDLTLFRYASFDDLVIYCRRVAGTVGLLMAHLFGVRDAATLATASDLGVAMQLTNICRDVAEDEQRGRVYIPADLLGGVGSPTAGGRETARAVAALLQRADDFYRRGDRGLATLPASVGVAMRAARLIYAEIGAVIARRGYDVTRGRAVVSPARKLWLIARAVLHTAVAGLGARRRLAA
ncbi:MAG TPA: phytoene/squalene synthase family protein [Verrucomicrobiae bacterium]|jgi:phytoene synthase|nr:phytoene/squalene synthase family protein [Verrucomicrobiae bacterium]